MTFDRVVYGKLEVFEPVLASCKADSHWQVCSLQRQVASFIVNLGIGGTAKIVTVPALHYFLRATSVVLEKV